MFLDFFYTLRNNGIPITLREHLDLLEAMEKEVAAPSIDDFYYLSKAILIKNEKHLDRFDVLFGQFFEGKQGLDYDDLDEFPEEWLRAQHELNLSEEEKAMIEEMGGFEEMLKEFRRLWEESREQRAENRDEDDDDRSRGIGADGTSPYGAFGWAPEGFRIGQDKSRHRRALKVWDKRHYKNLDDNVELNTRNLKMALRKLRILTREGHPDELNLNKTIRKTSENAGMLDIHMQASRKNRVRVLLLMDIGGSMDDHVRTCSELFSAAKYEFKHLEFYYYHNCLYEYVWKDNRRRYSERIPTWRLLNSYPKDYKVIFVGDAAMSPYELTHVGGSVEHWNEEPGFVWLNRMKDQFPSMAWINPNPERYWGFYESTKMLRMFMEKRMFPMTLGGLGEAMKSLKG
jgi:uncharacterized protein with von Willebrand factor type A (vWA) domain